jgi:CheY-like chemotaxis protein
MRTVLKEILQAFGVSAITKANDGQQGWQECLLTRPDIIFLDWKMPDMSGLEFAKTVRTSPSSPNPFVPIIMLTGHAQTSHVLHARDAGVTEVLAKPISPKSVLTRITTVIENPRSFVRTSVYFGPCRRRRSHEEYQGAERRTPALSTRGGADSQFVVEECALR